MSAFDHPLWRNAMTSIQSDVEDMGADELRERAMDIRLASEQEQISSADRMTFTLMVLQPFCGHDIPRNRWSRCRPPGSTGLAFLTLNWRRHACRSTQLVEGHRSE